MLPSILAKHLQKGIADYIETTFPMTNEPFKGSSQNMLATKVTLLRGIGGFVPQITLNMLVL